MSLKNHGILNIGTYNDNSREYHIDARGKDLSSIMRAIDSQETEAIQTEAWSEKKQANILPIPQKRKYSQVRKYIKERCRFDEEFRNFVKYHTRVELCMRLTNEFGWDVDEHALGVNMNRNR